MNEPLPTSGSRWTPAILSSVVVGLIVAGGLCALADKQFADVKAANAKLQDDRTKLAARVDALQSSLDTLSGQPKADTDAISNEFTDVNGKVSTLTDRVTALENKPAPTPPAPPPAPVAVNNSVSDSSALKLAVISGKPYANELAAWQKIYPKADTQAVATLAARAAGGIQTDAELNAALRYALDDASHIKKVDDTSLVGKINQHLGGLVSIKRSADAGPYAKLHADVMREDTDTLMAEVEKLSDEDRKPLESWLTAAHARRDALAALGKLDTAGGN